MSEITKTKTMDEKTLRKYLLGALSPQEQEELELWLMSDNDACDLLEAAEDDLIDESLAGKLKGQDMDRFNNHFLAAPERKRKLQFARSLHRSIKATHPRVLDVSERTAIPQAARTELSFWHAMFFGNRRARRFAVSALVVLLAAVSTWSVFRIAALQRELGSATSRIVEVGRERDEIKRQLDESQSAAEKLRAQIQTIEGTVRPTGPSLPPQTLLAFNLMPGTVRSSTGIRQIAIPANTRLVEFSLTLPDDNYQSYRADLLDADGKELWTRERLTATETRNGKVVVCSVPAPLLSSGDFSFSLWGISDSRQPERINNFNFRVARQ